MDNDHPPCATGSTAASSVDSESDTDSEPGVSEGDYNYNHSDQFLCLFPDGLPCDPNVTLMNLCSDCRTTDTDIERCIRLGANPNFQEPLPSEDDPYSSYTETYGTQWCGFKVARTPLSAVSKYANGSAACALLRHGATGIYDAMGVALESHGHMFMGNFHLGEHAARENETRFFRELLASDFDVDALLVPRWDGTRTSLTLWVKDYHRGSCIIRGVVSLAFDVLTAAVDKAHAVSCDRISKIDALPAAV